MAGVKFYGYEAEEIQPSQAPAEMHSTANSMRRGRAVALCLRKIRSTGFLPEVVYGHPGWGEMLHVKDVFPDARVVNYCEFYFNRYGQDLDFDPEFQSEGVDTYKVRTDNMIQLASLADGDDAISPTLWQRSRYPKTLASRIKVIHDGVDLSVVTPDSSAKLELSGSSVVLDGQSQVVTFVSRNLEPYRGFHVFMRSLPAVLKRMPKAQIVVVGGDEVSYGRKLPGVETYRNRLLAELGTQIDRSRVHFLGRVPYAVYLRVLQVSSVHVYLTYPFVLSWSVLEAMAVGGIVVGSRTKPVQEVIEDGVNGFLVDFFSHNELSDQICRVLSSREELAQLRISAAETIQRNFNLKRDCLGKQLSVLFPSHAPAGIPG